MEMATLLHRLQVYYRSCRALSPHAVLAVLDAAGLWGDNIGLLPYPAAAPVSPLVEQQKITPLSSDTTQA